MTTISSDGQFALMENKDGGVGAIRRAGKSSGQVIAILVNHDLANGFLRAVAADARLRVACDRACERLNPSRKSGQRPV
jgi:hypothetical protein